MNQKEFIKQVGKWVVKNQYPSNKLYGLYWHVKISIYFNSKFIDSYIEYPQGAPRSSSNYITSKVYIENIFDKLPIKLKEYVIWNMDGAFDGSN